MSWNGFRGAAKRLDDIDLPKLGHEIGVGEDELHAFMDVEASGAGFDSKKRPKMLFEPHVFWRNLPPAKRRKAQEAKLAYPKWKPGAYPKDSYPRLEKAMAIDEAAALKASSWGLTQILGENHAMIGYATVADLVRAFMADEEHHLKGAIDFLQASGIDDDLRAHRWDVVARVYNGPRYRQHDYDGRMKRAFEKWQKIRDTEWSPPEGPKTPVPAGVAKRAAAIATREVVKDVQEALRALGFPEVGEVDGKVGGKTRAALLGYRDARGLPLTPTVDQELLDDIAAAMESRWQRPIGNERATATKSDLVDSRVLDNTDRAQRHISVGQKILTWIGIGGAAAGGAEEMINPDQVEERLGWLQRVGAFAADNWWLAIMLAGIVGGLLYMRHARRRVEIAEAEEVQGYREGRHV